MDASTPFKWLDTLEQEFDRNYTYIDVLLDEADFDDTYDDCIHSQLRQRLSYIAGAFGQIVHKAVTIFQHNLKLEAKLLVAQEDAMKSEARNKTLTDEVKMLRAQLAAVSSLNNNKSVMIEQLKPDPSTIHQLEKEAERRMLTSFRAQMAIAEHRKMQTEIVRLGRENLSVKSEVEALKLTLKYLDKERAGRIQQIQLLGNSKMTPDDRNRVWSQLETEIALQRCKTVVQTCLIKQKKEEIAKAPVSHCPGDHPPIGQVRVVKYEKPKTDKGIGLSIVGGRDVALPIIVSSVAEDSILKNKISVGDLIKMANGVDLSQASRLEAVQAITKPPVEERQSLELVVCYLGGAYDTDHDDSLISSGNIACLEPNFRMTGLLDQESDKGSCDKNNTYETVWLQDGELWPSIPSGLLANSCSVPQPPLATVKSELPQSGYDSEDPVIDEKLLQASVATAGSSSLFGNPSNNGAVFTLKTGIQPRDDDSFEEIAARTSSTAPADVSNDSTGVDSQYSYDFSTTTYDNAFSADV